MHKPSRRDMLRLGAGAAAGAFFPDILQALTKIVAVVPSPHLDVALKAERWIRASRVETRTGAAWPVDPTDPEAIGTDLYNGMPGVVLFYLELFWATKDRRWLDEARAGANELIARLPVVVASGESGLYTGLGGVAFVLEETHRATGDGKFRDGANRAVQAIRAAAISSGAGVEWRGVHDIIGGSAGIGLALLWMHQKSRDPEGRALAIAAGHRLIELGQPAEGGMKWAPSTNGQRLYPNFSHGTSGVSYYLATLYQATGDRRFLAAALAGAKYLEAIASTESDDFKIFHSEPGNERIFYLSWCHGPAGTSRLFHRLAEVTASDRWNELTHRCARAIARAGVPEQRTPGFWNNVGQCCGNAGVGEFFLALNRVAPDASYTDMARRVAADTLRRGTTERDSVRWIQAEHRVRPDLLIAQTGHMQGAAGVGTFFLHMENVERSQRLPIAWPDTPFR